MYCPPFLLSLNSILIRICSKSSLEDSPSQNPLWGLPFSLSISNAIRIRIWSESILEDSPSFFITFHLNSNSNLLRILSGVSPSLFYRFLIKFYLERTVRFPNKPQMSEEKFQPWEILGNLRLRESHKYKRRMRNLKSVKQIELDRIHCDNIYRIDFEILKNPKHLKYCRNNVVSLKKHSIVRKKSIS